MQLIRISALQFIDRYASAGVMQRVRKMRNVPTIVATARGMMFVEAKTIVRANIPNAKGAFFVSTGASIVSLMIRKLSSFSKLAIVCGSPWMSS